MRIYKEKELYGEIPLSDIAVLLLTSRAITLTKEILLVLNNQGTPIIFCGNNYLPESIMCPIFGSYEFSGRLKYQLDVSLPQKKQIWKKIVQEKINNQGLILELTNHQKEARLLYSISNTVASGDSTNREAYAAREYWKILFGQQFSRKQDEDNGINAYLNYGYAILRSIIARALSTSGLLPSLGLHHSNSMNNYCLVDDLMEPFRPVVDYLVFRLSEVEELDDITPMNKSFLANIAQFDVKTSQGKSSLIIASEEYAHSLYESYRFKEVSRICIPQIIRKEITEQTNPLPF